MLPQNSQAQILLELVLGLALVSATIFVFLSLGNVLQNSLFFKFMQQRASAEYFEKYRQALYVISRRDWTLINNLTPGNIYNIYFDNSSSLWQIASGSATATIGLQRFQHFFTFDNFEGDTNVKVVTTTIKIKDYQLNDNFILPKTK